MILPDDVYVYVELVIHGEAGAVCDKRPWVPDYRSHRQSRQVRLSGLRPLFRVEPGMWAVLPRTRVEETQPR